MSTLNSKDKPTISLLHVDASYSPTEGTWEYSDSDADWSDSVVTWGGGDTVLNINKPKLK
jgi:hypothetical protein